MAKAAIWDKVDDKTGIRFLDYCPVEFLKSPPGKSDLTLYFKNNSTITLVGLDKNADSIRGVSCKGVIFSEFAFSDPDAFKVMVPALNQSEGFAIFNSTPNGHNHFINLYDANKDNDRWFVDRMQCFWPNKPYYEGRYKDLKEIEEEMRSEGMTIEDVEREYGTSAKTGSRGSFYAEFINLAEDSGRIGEFVYDTNFKVDTYWDIGNSDYTAVWFVQHVGNKRVHIDFYMNQEKGYDHYARILEERGYEYGSIWLPHDGNYARQGKDSPIIPIDLLEECLVNRRVSFDSIDCADRPRPKMAAIQAVRKMFSSCFFDEIRCKEGLEHLKLYRKKFNKTTGTFSNEPVHDMSSDVADALSTEALAPVYEHNVMKSGDLDIKTDFDIFD